MRLGQQVIRIGVVSMVILGCLITVASAQDISYAGAIPIGLAAVGAVTVSIVNTVQIARGDGSKGWGWAGIIVGSGIAIAFATYNKDEELWGYWAGGAVAGLGLWSVLLARRDHQKKATSRGVTLTPTVMYARDDRIRPGMVLSVGF